MKLQNKISFNLYPWQAEALFNPFLHFCMYGGVGIGKSYTGAHFSIYHIMFHPDKTGFIGANDYNQLSQVSLKELFYWLEQYGIPFVVDQIPPREWGQVGKKLKSYNNVLSVFYAGEVVTIFTRVLSDPDALRGLEFSWYWIDEIRDTIVATHDEILKRLRETNYVKGLATTTTNAEEWDYHRYVIPKQNNNKRFGCMHVPTIVAVEAGLLAKEYYETMLTTFSPLVAEQELFAKHVNTRGGRAYYTAGDHNKRRVAPWGDKYPSLVRPLIVGCDFNFQPAPCVWVVGQLGPSGTPWQNHIHWFREISGVEKSTVDLATTLAMQFEGFFFKIYGDASGKRGTTSNAGQTDYDQMSNVLTDYGCMFSIDVELSNPRVKDRVENVCRLLRDASGNTSMTYDPEGCPLLDGDFKMVGWRKNLINAIGKLDNAGDDKRTHASDGVGYAAWKVLPPLRRGQIIQPLTSSIRSEYGLTYPNQGGNAGWQGRY